MAGDASLTMRAEFLFDALEAISKIPPEKRGRYGSVELRLRKNPKRPAYEILHVTLRPYVGRDKSIEVRERPWPPYDC